MVTIIAGFVLLLPALAVRLFSPDETSFPLRASAQEDVIALPPTNGDIQLRFEPASNVQVPQGQRLQVGDPVVIGQCEQGCRIRFSLIDERVPTQVTVVYLAADSEYVNDIRPSSFSE